MAKLQQHLASWQQHITWLSANKEACQKAVPLDGTAPQESNVAKVLNWSVHDLGTRLDIEILLGTARIDSSTTSSMARTDLKRRCKKLMKMFSRRSVLDLANCPDIARIAKWSTPSPRGLSKGTPGAFAGS